MLLALTLFVAWVCAVSSSAGYDASTAQFHPSGRILQTEYAKRAVQQRGGPVCAVKCSDGILLSAARKVRNSKLVVESAKKVHFVDPHVCIAVSGFVFEATQLIDLAKQECASYREVYNSPIPVENLCDYLSNVLHMLTRDGRYRPLGVSLVVAGWDDELGPQLFTTDPEGSFSGWNAVAIGSKADDISKSLADIVKDGRKGSSVGSTVENIWPTFSSNILRKYFRSSSSTSKTVSQSSDNEQRVENVDETAEGDWVSESYACLKATSGEICWSRIDS